MLNIPRGIAILFAVDDSEDTIVGENEEHRTDRMLNNKSIKKELVNNYVSNTSPISCKKGDKYKICSSKFHGYFALR